MLKDHKTYVILLLDEIYVEPKDSVQVDALQVRPQTVL